MKKLVSILLSAVIILTLCVPSFAVSDEYTYVYDDCGLLTETEKKALDEKLGELNKEYNVPLAIIVKSGEYDSSCMDYTKNYINNNQDIFGCSGQQYGFVFTDDFDDNSYLLYVCGKASSIIDSDGVSAFYDCMYYKYDSADLYESYLSAIDYVKNREAVYSTGNSTYNSDYDYSAPATNGTNVNDDADLLSDDEEKALLATIDTIKAKYNFDIVLHTTNSIGKKSIVDYADDYYDYNGFGCGENKDGLLFMLNMNNGEEGNRDYYTSTCGYGITAFTDYAIHDSDSVISSLILDYLKDGDYYKAFTEYLSLADVFLKEATTNKPYDYDNPYRTIYDYVALELIALVVALIVAGIITGILNSKMKTNVLRKNAAEYIKKDSLIVRESCDIFSHATVSRTRRESSSSGSGGGGSSSHSSSSGSSHGGGGGKF